MEYAHRSSVVHEGKLPDLPGLPPAGPGRNSSEALDVFGDAFPFGTLQGLCSFVALALGRYPGLNSTAPLQWDPGGNEQHNQNARLSLFRFSLFGKLYRSDLSLLWAAPAPSANVITLLGEELKKLLE